MLGLETALALALTELDLPSRARSLALMSLAAGGRRGARPHRTIDGRVRGGDRSAAEPANLVCHRPRRHLGRSTRTGWPA